MVFLTSRVIVRLTFPYRGCGLFFSFLDTALAIVWQKQERKRFGSSVNCTQQLRNKYYYNNTLSVVSMIQVIYHWIRWKDGYAQWSGKIGRVSGSACFKVQDCHLLRTEGGHNMNLSEVVSWIPPKYKSGVLDSVLFIYGLFNDTVSISDYIGWLMTNKLKMIWN